MDSQVFIEKCKELVANYANAHSENVRNEVKAADVFVSWSSKTLQNNKALLSTPFSDGMYYELTFNGDKGEIYFDAYKKQENIKYNL